MAAVYHVEIVIGVFVTVATEAFVPPPGAPLIEGNANHAVIQHGNMCAISGGEHVVRKTIVNGIFQFFGGHNEVVHEFVFAFFL